LAGEAGSRPARKKTQTRTFAFFSTLRPPATAGGCPSPFEPLKVGFATGTERSGVERANPSYFAFERGKPGGEGEGQYMPPLHCRRSTMSLKVARPWVGVVDRVPHGVTHSRFDDLGKLWSGAKWNGTILTFFLLGGVPGFLCAVLCGNLF
jgi:hypothetical protein